MGRDTKTSPDATKATPGDQGGERTSYCERRHRLSVKSTVAVAVGDPVELVLASPPRVDSAGVEIGELDDVQARRMEACLLEGFRMSGEIEAVSGFRATILVAGVRA